MVPCQNCFPHGYGIPENTGWDKGFGPTLEKQHHKYFLRFTYTEETKLSRTAVKTKLFAVGLGINTDAVCTIMQADGTVIGGVVPQLPSEKDRLYRVEAESADLRNLVRTEWEPLGLRKATGIWSWPKVSGAITAKMPGNRGRSDREYLEIQGKRSRR